MTSSGPSSWFKPIAAELPRRAFNANGEEDSGAVDGAEGRLSDNGFTATGCFFALPAGEGVTLMTQMGMSALGDGFMVGQVHGVEPIDEFVGNIVSHRIVKLADSFAVTGVDRIPFVEAGPFQATLGAAE